MVSEENAAVAGVAEKAAKQTCVPMMASGNDAAVAGAVPACKGPITCNGSGSENGHIQQNPTTEENLNGAGAVEAVIVDASRVDTAVTAVSDDDLVVGGGGIASMISTTSALEDDSSPVGKSNETSLDVSANDAAKMSEASPLVKHGMDTLTSSVEKTISATTATTSSATVQLSRPPIRRVLVLGAGMAGLAAANELQTRGYDVLVVEARSRVGGRLKATHLTNASSTLTSSNAPLAAAVASATATTAPLNTTPSKAQSSPKSFKKPPPSSSPPPTSSTNLTATAAAATANIDMVPVDIGGALIHGVTGNPVYELVSDDMRVATRPVSECLLLTNSGWPVDVTEDERISTAFNECLSETFRRINEYMESSGGGPSVLQTTKSTVTVGTHNDKGMIGGAHFPLNPHHDNDAAMAVAKDDNAAVAAAAADGISSRDAQTSKLARDERLSDSKPAAVVPNQVVDLDATSSFGSLFEQVCLERGVNCKTALFQWHQANLEVSCGAPFAQLGWHWNDDEPYGYEGEHVAVCPSWQAVCERLAEPLSILYQTAVEHVQLVHPPLSSPPPQHDGIKAVDGTTTDPGPTATAADTRTIRDEEEVMDTTVAASTVKVSDTSPHEIQPNNTNTTMGSDPNDDATATRGNDRNESIDSKDSTNSPTLKRKAANGGGGSNSSSNKKRSRNVLGDYAVLAPQPERYSRRIRGEGANAPRRSVRPNKGAGIVDRFTVDHSTDQMLRRQSSSPKRAKKSNNGAAAETDHRDNAGPPNHSFVKVRLSSGVTLQADAVVCTLPLAMLKGMDDVSSSGRGQSSITFDPPLPLAKQQAIQRLGAGLLNKCALRFSKQFWQDSDFLGLADTRHSYLVLNAAKYMGKPVLLFMYGGAFAKEVEDWTDAEVVEDCLAVLRRMCGRELVTAPLDYHFTRWGKETFSRMSFTYVPPGVDGHAELQAMGSPILDHSGQVPLLMFAGEHTTPFHPSTIHGAFISGIREAYRLDCAADPVSNDFLEFTDDDVFQRTFTMKRKAKGSSAAEAVSESGSTSPATIPSRAAAASVLSVVTRAAQSSSTGPSQPSLRYGRRGAVGAMQLRSRPKTVLNLEPTPPAARKPASASSTTEQQPQGPQVKSLVSPSRRSQRSTATTTSFPESVTPLEATSANASKKSTNGDHPIRDFAALENRMLQRGLESYGEDYEYLRTVTLPVQDSSTVHNVLQIQQRCHRLVQKRDKSSQSRRKSQASGWESWIAREYAPLDIKPKGAASVSDSRGETTLSNAKSKPGTQLRSGRITKPPP